MDSARGKNPDPRRFLGDRRIDIVIVTLPALLRGILVALLNTRLRPNILAEFDHRPNQAQLYGLLPDCLLLGLRPGEAPDKAAAPFAALNHGASSPSRMTAATPISPAPAVLRSNCTTSPPPRLPPPSPPAGM